MKSAIQIIVASIMHFAGMFIMLMSISFNINNNVFFALFAFVIGSIMVMIASFSIGWNLGKLFIK